MENKRFVDKVMIITGAASGIGYTVAKLAAKEGASIVFSDLQAEKGREAEQALRKINPNVEFLPLDMTLESSAQTLVNVAVKKYNHVDILINNAGITGKADSVHNMAGDMFKKVIDCNIVSMFYCSHYAVLQMLRQNSESSIVNLASIASLVGSLNNVAYVTSKHAVIGLTKCMALDYAQQKIRVNAVSPGIISTPMQQDSMKNLLGDNLDKVLLTKLKNNIPLKLLSPQNRVADTEEVAKAILFLASSDASHITGVNLPVDGGYTIY